MKSLVLDAIIFGLQRSGGISRLWADILKGLDEEFALNFPIYVLIPPNDNIEWRQIKETLKNIRVIPRRKFRWGRRRFFAESLYLSRVALKLRCAVWHTSFFVGFPLFPHIFKLSYLYDMIPEKLSVATSYETRLKYLTLKHSDKALSISQHTHEDLKNIWPLFSNKSKVNLIGTSFKRTCKREPQPYFLYMGTRKGYKNFLPVVDALMRDSYLSTFSLYVIGGEPQWSASEEKLFKDNRERIHKKEILDSMNLEKLLASCTALIYPSLYEGFGLPVLEAFRMGVPVVAFRTSSIPEITGEAYPLADPDKPETFMDTLKVLINERDRWVEYGYQREKLFTQETLLAPLCELYRKELMHAL